MLSVCGTPIGNLSDASPRLVETLSRADVVCCEDTRVTAKLLAHFGIRVATLRCDENVIEARIPELLERLEAGERVAFVSDAGMPCISDPGQQLVDALSMRGSTSRWSRDRAPSRPHSPVRASQLRISSSRDSCRARRVRRRRVSPSSRASPERS